MITTRNLLAIQSFSYKLSKGLKKVLIFLGKKIALINPNPLVNVKFFPWRDKVVVRLIGQEHLLSCH